MPLSKSNVWYSNNCLHFLKHAVPLTVPIDIESLKIDCWGFVMCPLLAKSYKPSFFLFLLRPLTVPMKQTRQLVHAIKQSIYLDVYNCSILSSRVRIQKAPSGENIKSAILIVRRFCQCQTKVRKFFIRLFAFRQEAAECNRFEEREILDRAEISSGKGQ